MVDFFNGETRTPEYRALNVMGEVPSSSTASGRLSQSGVILDYLAERFGDFGAEAEEERREILRWTLWDNHKLTGYLGHAALHDELPAGGQDATRASSPGSTPRAGSP